MGMIRFIKDTAMRYVILLLVRRRKILMELVSLMREKQPLLLIFPVLTVAQETGVKCGVDPSLGLNRFPSRVMKEKSCGVMGSVCLPKAPSVWPIKAKAGKKFCSIFIKE